MSQYGSAARNNPDDAPAPDPRSGPADLAKSDTVRPHGAHPDAARAATPRPDPAGPQAARPPASPERGAAAGRFAVVPGGDRAAERPSEPARPLPGPRTGDPQPASATPAQSGSGGWLGVERTQRLRAEWHSVQAGFVDDPRQSVQQADALIEKSVGLLAEAVTERRHRLRGAEAAPDGTPAASTEDLRLTLREYRSLLDRLLDT
ncbi:hypothetical protein [Kitasatospora purpeofusca]|uniref:hypothetical protein n=1 Tax=Kitasatospora purpeofusca TaxID=67352 RepID=UPI00069008CE|nr:hypothetical protein [Kitasatospora purpeofusca]